MFKTSGDVPITAFMLFLTIVLIMLKPDRIPARPWLRGLGPPVQSAHWTTYTVNKCRPRPAGSHRLRQRRGEERDASHFCENDGKLFHSRAHALKCTFASSAIIEHKQAGTRQSLTANGEQVLYIS